VRRAPTAGGGPSRHQRDERGRRPDGDRARRDSGGRRDGDGRRSQDDRRPRQEDRGPRSFEPPVPQDPRSIELGVAFREAQVAMRDAKKALDKRRAEFGDEPEWLIEQLAAAEAHFVTVADQWAAHLETTGRKVVRNR
jgi:hypothetical protein